MTAKASTYGTSSLHTTSSANDVEVIKAAMEGRRIDFYSQFTTLVRQGREYRGPCPIHGGDDANFAVDPDTGLWFCHSQCDGGGDELDFLQRKEGMDFTEARTALAQFAHVRLEEKPSQKPASSKKSSIRKQIVKVYPYLGLDGRTRHETVRYEPKSFGQRVPTDEPGVYLYSLHGVDPILYRLPEVTAGIAAGQTIFVVEGEKDADNLSALGLCGTTNAMGAGKWREDYSEALIGAKVVILPDNDAKGETHAIAVAASLRGKAKRVRIVHLPGLPEKGDVSDWLAAGGTREELIQFVRAAPDLPNEPLPMEAAEADTTSSKTEKVKDGAAKDGTTEAPDHPYRETPGGLVWNKPTQSGPVKVPLTNFTAKIASDVQEDDGAQSRRFFEIVAKRAGREYRFSVPASAFAQMNWPMEHMGAAAIVLPGFGAKDHARAAIQMLSGEVPETQVYSHTGWRHLPSGEWVYLHAGGAIGSDHPVQVNLPQALAGFLLPAPITGDALISAIHAHLRLWSLAPDSISVPMSVASPRTVLGGCDFGIHDAGSSGVFKSEIAALAQQHLGAGLDARHLPGSWSSTDNALEGLAFTLKDALCVIDDFAPTGTMQDVARLHARADRVLRGQGNSAGKGRMNADGTLRATKYSRGLILSTGEDVPSGQSLRARMLTLEITPGMIDPERLTACQKDAAEGLYAQAMSGFLCWVAPQYDAIQARLQAETLTLRDQAQRSGQHRRTPGIVASLGAGLKIFLQFALESGAITEVEQDALWQRGWTALGASADAQAQHQSASEPTARYRELLAAAIASGRAHVAASHGSEPKEPEAWGWRQKEIGAGESYRTEWQPQGDRVGWIDEDDLYLEPDAAHGVAKRLGEAGGDSLTISAKTLHKRLHEKGLLSGTEGTQGTLTIRKMLEGQRRRVLHVRAGFLSAELGVEINPETADAPTPDIDVDAASNCPSGQIMEGMDRFRGQIIDPQNKNLSTKSSDFIAPLRWGDEANGQIGQIGQFIQTPYTPRVDNTPEGMCQRAILGHLGTRLGQPEVTTGIVRAMEGAGFTPQLASAAIRHLQDDGQIIRTATGFVVSPTSPLLD